MYLSAAEVAEKLKVSRSLIYALARSGALRCVRLGKPGRRGVLRFHPEEVGAFVERMQAGPQAEPPPLSHIKLKARHG